MVARPRRHRSIWFLSIALVVVVGIGISSVVISHQDGGPARRFSSVIGPPSKQFAAVSAIYRDYRATYDPSAAFAPDGAAALWTALLIHRSLDSTAELLPAVADDECSDPETNSSAFLLDPRSGTALSNTLLRHAVDTTPGLRVADSGVIKSANGMWMQLVLDAEARQVTFFVTTCESKSDGADQTKWRRYERTFSIAPDDPVLLRNVETTRDRIAMNTTGAMLDVGFDNAVDGAEYSESAASEEWDNEFGSISNFTDYPQGSLTISEENGESRLVKDFAAGSFNNGPGSRNNKLNIVWKLKHKQTDAFFAYRVRTSDSFDPALGGKLPGVCGGTCPVGGADVVEVDGDGVGESIGWSARNMWRQNGYLVQYSYLPNKTATWGADLRYMNDGLVYVNDGLWHTIEHHVVMNTPGKSDGILEAWVDGVKVLELDDVRYRDDYSFGIDSVKFTSYFGGHDADWAPKRDSQILFDDVVLSSHPITHND